MILWMQTMIPAENKRNIIVAHLLNKNTVKPSQLKSSGTYTRIRTKINTGRTHPHPSRTTVTAIFCCTYCMYFYHHPMSQQILYLIFCRIATPSPLLSSQKMMWEIKHHGVFLSSKDDHASRLYFALHKTIKFQ